MASPTHQATYGSSWRMEGLGASLPATGSWRMESLGASSPATLPPSPALTLRDWSITQTPKTPPSPVRPSWLDVFFSCGEGHAEGLDCPPTPRIRMSGRSSLAVGQLQQRLERDQLPSTAIPGAGAGGAGSPVPFRRAFAFEGLGFFGADACNTL